MACARTATPYGCEPPPRSARGVGRGPSGSPPPRVPLVPRRAPQGTLHILLGRVRRRVATTIRSRLPARTGLPARSRRLRAMRPGHRSPPQGQAQARLRRAPPIREGLGPPPPVGRRPHRARGGRRRRMRPRQHAHALPEMPPRRNTSAVEAPAWRAHFACCAGTRADAWSADPKLTRLRGHKSAGQIQAFGSSRGNEPPFVRSSHSLLKDAAGFGIHLDLRLIANKRIDTLQLTHTSNLHDSPKRRSYRNVTANSHYREGARQ